MVPKAPQAAVWAHYRPGQEVDKRPTREYLEAAHAAVMAVAKKELQRASKERQRGLF